MKYRLLKDRRRRILHASFERRRIVLRSIIENSTLPFILRGQAYRALLLLPRDSSVTRRRNRCTLTGRSRAIVRKFGLSRLMFRSLALAGKLVGVKKASWLCFNYIANMDSLSSRITTILNAQRAGRKEVIISSRQGGGSKRGLELLRLLVREGYVESFTNYSKPTSIPQPIKDIFTFSERPKNASYLKSSISKEFKNSAIGGASSWKVQLKYGPQGEPAILSFYRISIPGRRVFVSTSSLWQPQSMVGNLVLSTSCGLKTDREARQQNLGGEVLRGIR